MHLVLKNESTEISDDHVEEVVPESKASATITHENDVVLKPTTKVKKSTSHPSAKRQRIASPVVDKRSPVTSKIESKPTEQHTTDHLIQFKMEPYEADQSDQAQAEGYEENPDDNFADDGVDEAHMDDSEYQETILKGEEEPQAGTSGDGMGESQGTWSFFIRSYAQITFSVLRFCRYLTFCILCDQGKLYLDLGFITRYISTITDCE